VLLGVGVVLCAFGAARTLWDEQVATVAALGALLVYPMFYYARNSNVDVPVLFFTAAGLWAFAAIARHGLTRRRAVIFGALVGCAVATKEPAFASFVFVPLVLPFMRDPGSSRGYWSIPAFWATAVAATGAAFAAYAIGSGMVIDFARWQAHLNFIRERTELARSGGVIFTTYYPMTWAGHVALARQITSLLVDAMSLPGLLLGVAGVVLALRRAPRAALLAVSALGYLLILFFSARVIQLRYVMPITFILALYAGFAVVSAWRSAVAAVRWGSVALAGAGAAILLLWALDLTYGMIRDSRYAAAAWIAATARPGDALEYFGSEHKHPPMPAWLSSRQAIPFRGSTFRADTGAAAVASVIQGWNERRPRFVAIVPDYTSPPGAPHAASCPPAIYRALEDGSLGYRRAAFFQTPALLPWARRPSLDHPVVNPPIRLYERTDAAPAAS
jgi:4-amino-4-deoxy-L-arabinose transferase-like glycosyltransferase